MKEPEYILGIDCGTSSVKTGLFDLDMNLVAETKSPHSYMTNGVAVEIDPNELFASFLRSLEGLKEYLPHVRALGFSGLCPNLILMDEDGNALANGIIHLDRRSEKQGLEIVEKFGEERFISIAGNVPCPGGMSVTSLMWMRENRPEIYNKAYKFGHTTSYFVARLTGRFIMDPPNLGFNGLYDTVGMTGWSEEICAALDIRRSILPEIVMAFEEAGRLTADAARMTGLPEGILVIAGAADTACSVYGAGCDTNGTLLNSTGTVEVMAMCTDKPHATGRYLLRPACNAGHWVVMNLIGAGGESLNWFYNNFCRDMEKSAFFNEYLPSLLGKLDTDVFMTPYLAGDRCSVINKAAVITGLTLSSTRDDILVGLVKGLISQLKDGMADFERFAGKLSDTIFFTGGGAGALFEYKKQIFPQFSFEVVDNSAMKGIGRLIREAYEKERNR